jgi:predicted alpha/beta hydrolase family esterase
MIHKADTIHAVNRPAVYFLHGMESGPIGSKSQALREIMDLQAPDFQGMDIEERLEKAMSLLAREENHSVVLIGSSLGGLLATLLWSLMSEKIAGLLLLVPAWERADLSHIQALHPNTQVILAEDEEVLSVESQKEQCRKWKIEPVLVTDTHRLGGNLEIIKKVAIEVCAACRV